MEKFLEGDVVLYQNGNCFELGVVKRVCDNGDCFVWYHTGDTAARTSPCHLHKLSNSYAFFIMRLSCDSVPSSNNEAFECLKNIYTFSEDTIYQFEIEYNIVKQALLKQREQEKALEIILKKQVDINEIKILLVNLNYCNDVERCRRYNITRKVGYKLKKLEFDLLEKLINEEKR